MYNIIKKYNFQFSTLSLIAALLFITSCNSTGNHHADEQSQHLFTSDSLWTPTGDSALDSLLQLAATAPQDTNLVKLYDQIGDMYTDNDPEKAKKYYLKMGDLSEQLNWNEGRYLYATGFACLLIREMSTDSALVILQKAIELAKREEDELWIASILVNIGMAYHAKDWHETALSYYMEALPIYERKNNNQKLTLVYSVMSQLYVSLYAPEKAIEYAEKAAALDSENEYALFALSRAYFSAHQFEKAKDYCEKALRICESKNNIYSMASIYYYLSSIAMMTFDLDNAEKYAQQSLEISKPFGSGASCANYVLLSKLELLKGNYSKSEEYAKEGLQMAIEFEALQEQELYYGILSELAIAQRKPREYIQYWAEAELLDKEIATETALLAGEEMNAKYETAKKEFEIERQQQVIAHQNMQRWLLAGGVVVCVVILALLWYLLRLRNRRNYELAEINRTKDKFFNIISHDLKNPAIAQRDTLQTLVKNAHTWDADTLADYHIELLKSAEGEVELIYNLLGWAQLQTGRIAYTPQTFLLSDLRPQLSLISKMAEHKDIIFDIQIPENALITADSNILTTVIRNLLTNAIKFTAAGGTVKLDIVACDDVVRDGRDAINRVSTAPKYTISITDTGIGMSETQLRDLFRLDGAHSQQGTAGEQGSGLGLIVCKELIGKHGSVLHVESEMGKGSRFWFEV